MGNVGFRALLARAVVLASTESALSSIVQVSPDGTLVGLDQFEAGVTRGEFTEASVVLISRLLGLLVEFIGEDLTLRLLREIWPAIGPHSRILPTDPKK